MMRNIKNYKLFLEDNGNEELNVSMARQNLETFNKNITEYNSSKSSLSDLYLNIDTKTGSMLYNNEDLKLKVESIVGKEDIQNGKDRNPLLLDLMSVLSLQRRLIVLQSRNDKDTESENDLQTQISSEQNEDTKKSLVDQNKIVSDRIIKNNQSITQLLTDINSSNKDHIDKMSSMEEDLKNNINKISNNWKMTKIWFLNIIYTITKKIKTKIWQFKLENTRDQESS